MNKILEKKNIPKEWNVVKFRDVCDVEFGKKVDAGLNNYLEIGDVDIKNGSYDISQKVKKTVSGSIQVPKGTLLISKVRPTRGAITVLDNDTNVSAGFSRLKIASKFFYYVASQDKFLKYLGDRSTGSTYPTCKDEDILEYQFLCPVSISEQERISELLETVDAQIQQTEGIIKTTEKLKKGLMQDLFTKGIGHAKFKETELGIIPSEWKVKRLSEVAEIKRGKFSHRPRNDPKFYGGNIPFIQTGDVVSSDGRISRFSQTLNERGSEVSKLFPSGTIIMTIAANIGDTGILSFDSCFPDSLVGITTKDEIDPIFLEYFLRTRKAYLNSIATKSAQKNINLEKLEPMSVVVPPAEEQEKISMILESVNEKEKFNKRLLEKQKQIKKGLMQDLLSGEVRVKI